MTEAPDDDLPETPTEETSLSSPALPALSNASVQSVALNYPNVNENPIALLPKKRRSPKPADTQERPTTTEPVARRRGRPRKQQTKG